MFGNSVRDRPGREYGRTLRRRDIHAPRGFYRAYFDSALLCCLNRSHSVNRLGRTGSALAGSRTVVRSKHLIPAMKGGEGYGDKYTFDADFGERGNMYFSMAISNLGLGDHKMQAKGRLTIGTQVFRWKKKLDSDEWSHAKDKFEIKPVPLRHQERPIDSFWLQKRVGANLN